MIKILLLNSPIYKDKNDSNNENYLPPFGLGYIATNLKKNNIEAKIIDCTKDNLTKSDIYNIIQLEHPDYVGINIFTPNFEIVKDIVISYGEKISFIIGGQITKFVFNDIVSWETTNKIIIIIGEGDYIVGDIISENVLETPIYSTDLRKVYIVNKGSVYFPKDLSALKLERGLFNRDISLNHFNLYEDSIITSRGCLYNCAFCGAARGLNKDISVRERTKEDIIEEINNLKFLFPQIQCIRVLDDLFLKNSNSIRKAIEIFNETKLYWRAMTHILSLSNVEMDILEYLKKGNCLELFIGIESGSETMRERIRKEGSLSAVKAVVRNLLSTGINIKGYFIYGFPDESFEDCEKTYQLAVDLKEISLKTVGKFRVSVFQFRPYHGTVLYNEIISKNRFIRPFAQNDELKELHGRRQFNFFSDNYSSCTKEQIDIFILKTMGLNKGV